MKLEYYSELGTQISYRGKGKGTTRGRGGPSVAALLGPAGLVVVGDHLWHHRLLLHYWCLSSEEFTEKYVLIFVLSNPTTSICMP